MKLQIITSLFLGVFLLSSCSDNENATKETANQVVEKSVAIVKHETTSEKGEKIVEPVKETVTKVAKKVEKVVEKEKPVSEAKNTDDTGTVHRVEMKNSGADGIMVFVPGYLKINKGDTVNFVATDAGHNAVSEVTTGDAWQVGFSGGKVTFNSEGVEIYYCVPHRAMAMYGVIQVGNATNKDDAISKAAMIDNGFAMNHGRLKKYTSQIK
jgi:pseudoazurin